MEYGLQVFLPKISKLSANAERIDIVWDIYLEESLNASRRSNRGKGTRRKVEANTRTTGKWESFIRHAENKTELFTFLAPLMTSSFCSDKILLCTMGNSIVTNSDGNFELLSFCSHEEADTRMFLHAMEMSKKGLKKVLIVANDTDVVVIVVAHFFLLDLEELWVRHGAGTKTRYTTYQAL